MKYIYIILLSICFLACKEKSQSSPPVDTSEQAPQLSTNDDTKGNVDKANEIGKLNAEIDKLNVEISKEIQALENEK